MNSRYNYQRRFSINRNPGKVIDLGPAGLFNEVRYTELETPEDAIIGHVLFKSVHIINQHKSGRIFTAYRSDQEPGILFIVWEKFPFYPHIEEGGDFILQVLASDKRVKYIVNDNTFVKSGWVDDKMADYLNNAWMPGLVQLELAVFCHLQAESYLGGLSFKKFGEIVSSNVNGIAAKLKKKPFQYVPIETSEMTAEGKIDDTVRKMAMMKSMAIVKNL